MNLMLLAAGEGTRLRPHTLKMPKPAIPFLNVPLAAHSLSFIEGLIVDKLVVNTFHLPDKIHHLFKTLPHGARELHFSDETGEILGSGGGLGKARSYFQGGGDFIMMNADEVILPEDPRIVTQALTEHQKSGALVTLMVKDHPGVGTEFGGVWTDKDNNILGFGKTPIAGSVKGWHFIGVQILSEKIFDFIPQQGVSNILYDAVTEALKQGHKAKAFPFHCQWYETGNPRAFLQATQECLDFLNAPGLSFQKKALGKTLRRFGHKESAEHSVQADVLKSASAVIAPKAQLSGFICAGSGCSIPASAHLHNVVIGPGVQVPERTQASDTLFL